MVLSWLRAGVKSDDVNALMARKDYKSAIGALRAQLQKDPQNVFARQQLADAFVAAGDKKQAITILEQLAGDFARDGFAAKSISVLKKIQRIDPAASSVDGRLADAIQAKQLDDEKLMSIRTRPRKLESIDDFIPPVPSSRPAPPPRPSPSVRELDASEIEPPPQAEARRTTNYELRITNYELRITNYELRITNYELLLIHGGFRWF